MAILLSLLQNVHKSFKKNVYYLISVPEVVGIFAVFKVR